MGSCISHHEQEFDDAERTISVGSILEKKAQIRERHSEAALAPSEPLFMTMFPPEVIAEIFWHSLPLDALRDPELSPRKAFSAAEFFKLGAVCQSWRKIAWQTPALWSTIYIHATPWTVDSKIDMLEEWLGRSGHVPLDIGLSADLVLHEEDGDYCKDPRYDVLLAIAIRHASRWSTLVFQLPGDCYNALPGPDEPMPLLTTLHIEPTEGIRRSFYQFQLGHAPSLQSLILIHLNPSSLTLSYDKITDLHLTSVSIDECLYVLARCPDVIRCKFASIVSTSENVPPSFTPPKVPIHLPSLKFFQISDLPSSDQDRFFTSIILPELVEIKCRCPTVNIVAMCNFVSKSTKLEVFRLHRAILTDYDFVRLLQALPSIKAFWYTVPKKRDFSPLTDRVLKELGKKSGSGRPFLLPELETFKYTGPQSFNWTYLFSAWNSRKARPIGRIASEGSSQSSADTNTLGWKTFDVEVLKRLDVIPKTPEAVQRELKRLQKQPSDGLKVTFDPSYEFDTALSLSGFLHR